MTETSASVTVRYDDFIHNYSTAMIDTSGEAMYIAKFVDQEGLEEDPALEEASLGPSTATAAHNAVSAETAAAFAPSNPFPSKVERTLELYPLQKVHLWYKK